MPLPTATLRPAQRPVNLTGGNGAHVSDQLLDGAHTDGQSTSQ